MATRKIPFIVGEYYHIYNRGVDKRTIFMDEHDYRRFRVLLYLCNGNNPLNMQDLLNKGLPFIEFFSIDRGEQLVDIGAYCLMPNHFHILVKECIEGGISKFMEKLATSYVMYFNTKGGRRGSLFEGSFKAKHIDSEPYLNWIFSYIHTNPVKLFDPNWNKDGIQDSLATKDFIDNYKYSSYHDYFIDNRLETIILNKNVFPDHFSQMNDFEGILDKAREENY